MCVKTTTGVVKTLLKSTEVSKLCVMHIHVVGCCNVSCCESTLPSASNKQAVTEAAGRPAPLLHPYELLLLFFFLMTKQVSVPKSAV